MKRVLFLGVLLLITLNCLLAEEEYLSESYLKEITSQSKSIEESNESIEVINPFKKKHDEVIETINPFEQQHDEVVETINPFKQPEVIESNQTVKSTSVVEANSSVEDQNMTLSPYQKALKEAKLEGKIVMIAIRAAHCKYCDKMEKETLSDKSVQEALKKNFVTVYYNQDLEILPLELQKGVTPNFIFVDTDENILEQYPGMRTPSEFKEVLKQILSM